MENDATIKSQVQKITSQRAALNDAASGNVIDRNNQVRAIQFKAAHGLLIAFFLWIL